MPTTQRQPLTRDAKHYPPSNPDFLLQGHWLVDHKHSDSLRKHLQAMVRCLKRARNADDLPLPRHPPACPCAGCQRNGMCRGG